MIICFPRALSLPTTGKPLKLKVVVHRSPDLLYCSQEQIFDGIKCLVLIDSHFWGHAHYRQTIYSPWNIGYINEYTDLAYLRQEYYRTCCFVWCAKGAQHVKLPQRRSRIAHPKSFCPSWTQSFQHKIISNFQAHSTFYFSYIWKVINVSIFMKARVFNLTSIILTARCWR